MNKQVLYPWIFYAILTFKSKIYLEARAQVLCHSSWNHLQSLATGVLKKQSEESIINEEIHMACLHGPLQ